MRNLLNKLRINGMFDATIYFFLFNSLSFYNRNYDSFDSIENVRFIGINLILYFVSICLSFLNHKTKGKINSYNDILINSLFFFTNFNDFGIASIKVLHFIFFGLKINLCSDNQISIGLSMIISHILLISKEAFKMSYNETNCHVFFLNLIALQLITYDNYLRLKTQYNSDSLKNVIFLGVLLSQVFYIVVLIYINIKQLFNVFLIFVLNYQSLIIYWLILISISIVLIEIIDSRFRIKPMIKRKCFHLLSIAVIYPSIVHISSLNVLSFVFLAVLYLFITLEILRNIFKNFKIFKKISEYLQKNIDERDNSEFILTHTFLFYGCICPIIFQNLESGVSNYELKIIGIILLGVGDSMASIIGVKYGVTKIYPISRKSLEGTSAAIISAIIAFYYLTNLFNWKIILYFILVFVYEGLTLQIDNLVLPLVGYRLYRFLIS